MQRVQCVSVDIGGGEKISAAREGEIKKDIETYRVSWCSKRSLDCLQMHFSTDFLKKTAASARIGNIRSINGKK